MLNYSAPFHYLQNKKDLTLIDFKLVVMLYSNNVTKFLYLMLNAINPNIINIPNIIIVLISCFHKGIHRSKQMRNTNYR